MTRVVQYFLTSGAAITINLQNVKAVGMTYTSLSDEENALTINPDTVEAIMYTNYEDDMFDRYHWMIVPAARRLIMEDRND